MKTKMGAPRCSCARCIVGADDFEDGTINDKWTTIVGSPNESSGLVTILSDDDEYMVWEDDPLLEVGVTGVSLELCVRFTKEPDHPTTPGAYISGHGFDIIWDWRGIDEFVACKLFFAGSLANPTLKIGINDQIIDDIGNLGTFDLDPDILPTDWVCLKICIFQDADYYGYGYGYGETGWKIRVRAGGRERIFSIPEPDNLRAGFGASINGSTGDNYYEVDNWKISKINENCHCENPTPCVVYFNSMDVEDSTNLGSDFEEEVGNWEVLSNLLKPPSSGKLKLLVEPPSIGITGVKWQSSWHFGGSIGKARWRVNSNSNSYYAEMECTGSNTATLSLYSTTAGLLAGPVNVTGFAWMDPDNVSVCITKNTLIATVNNGDAFVAASGITLFDGIYVGLETVGVGSSARFNDLELSKLGPTCEGCLESIDCCVCINSEFRTHKYLRAKISNVSYWDPLPPGGIFNIGSACSTLFNRTFILPLAECSCITRQFFPDCNNDSIIWTLQKYLRYEKSYRVDISSAARYDYTVSIDIFQKDDGTWWIYGGILIFYNDDDFEPEIFGEFHTVTFGPIPWIGEGDCLSWDSDIFIPLTDDACPEFAASPGSLCRFDTSTFIAGKV